jgi:Xaa-Pro aminopeptidase
MEAAGIDVLVATSKHNTAYLLGGYRFSFFSAMDAIAIAIDHLRKIGVSGRRIGIEPPFLPSDAYITLRAEFDDVTFVDAGTMMERMRALKTPDELDKLRHASELITDSMLATIGWAQPGSTKTEIIEHLRREQTNRGLHFGYCLLTLGSSQNRAASNQAWQRGEILSIDSGGNYQGYIGDLCRMGISGDPDSELLDLLGEIEAVQQAAFFMVKAGTRGGDMIARAGAVLKASPNAPFIDFFAHGMGLITHEAPFLMTNHPVHYDGVDAQRPLEAGMVISVETAMRHPTRGFIKLEDTLAITDTGFEMFGKRGRGWNRGG